MKSYKTDFPEFSEEVTILETTDTDHAGNFNIATRQIFENTLVLKETIEEPSGVAAGTYRSVTVDEKGRVVAGSNPTTYTHPSSGVTAGTYKSVTVNAQGHVTSGSNPNTLAGFGITNTRPVIISSSAPGDTTALWIS